MTDLDAIRDRIDILDLVGESVQLKKAGRTYKGLCPFHAEKTPSFIVSPERRSWHCFGSCATGGDVFSFVMRRDNLDFSEAVRTLAERAGVEVASRRRAEDARTPRLLQANEAAAGYFHNALLNAAEAAAARDYVARRGLDAATIRAFELGYAPDSWDSLGGYLRGRAFTDEEARDAGLVVESERGRHDRFRGRLMFPIRDERSRVVGFGGRSLGDGAPKYLNSPQSPIFDKGSLLFALDRAKDAIRREDQAVIVEGYLDAITAHQFGYINVVATLGTALTERHVALIKRYAARVALALDADAAGQEAALRGEQLIRELGGGERAEVVVEWGNLVRIQSRAPVDVRLFSVPAGKDPDEAIRAEPDAWPGWVDAALPPFEFRLRWELGHTDRNDPRQRVQLLDRMLPLLTEVGDRALQAGYLSRLATVTGVREDDVRMRLNETLPSSRRGQALREHERAGRQPAAPLQPPPSQSRLENFCLALLLRFPELRETGLQLSPDAFINTGNRLIFEQWCGNAALSEEALPQPLQEQWQLLQNVRIVSAVVTDPAAALDDCLRRMALRQLEEQKRLLTATIVEHVQSLERATLAPATGSELASADSAGPLADPDLAEQLLADIETGRSLHLLEYELRTGLEKSAWQPATE